MGHEMSSVLVISIHQYTHGYNRVMDVTTLHQIHEIAGSVEDC